MKTFFVSDIHLNQRQPHIQRLFFDFLKQQTVDCQQLYILGDLFEYWIGDDAAQVLDYGACLSSLKKLADSGIEIYFMRGNRDFLVGEDFARDTGITLLTEPHLLQCGQRKTLLLHGDALCIDDVVHQQFRQKVLDTGWQKDFLRQSLPYRLDMARQARQQSKQHKSGITEDIMDVNVDAVLEMLAQHDVDLMIHGHTHKPDTHRHHLNGKTIERIVLGAWYEKASFLLFDGEKFELTH